MRLVLLGTIPGMTFAVIMAPTLIPVVYGDAWDAVVPIFQAFGVAALLRFQMVMLEWLFVAEDRTREFRGWAVARTILMVGSFAAGLPWGGLGVATAFAAAMLFLMLPWLVFTVTRGSRIRPADIGLTIALFVPGTVLAIAAMAAVTAWAGLPDWLALLVCLALSYGLVWATAWLFPAGRRSFRLGLDVIRHARSGETMAG
jgi:PST family polysaccharide transporter